MTATRAVGIQQSRHPSSPVLVQAPFSLSRSVAGVLGSEKATEEYGGGGIGQSPALELERIGRGTVNASARQAGRTALGWSA
ncbi:uncharacterized protein TrAFT101_009207 [Trichoderma asperellum]|uniref:uncharacterized protein n=1 Tax=Trichoderma asperellum TaxID=101201 RepID=UPI00332164A6|nr:hypothetical protein TrAFT101_009207 [Trichoderma asperellum]